MILGSTAHAELSCRFDATLGNALDPGGIDTVATRDPRGFGAFYEGRTRSPSGLPYDSPFVPPTPTRGEHGWSYQGSVEAGFLGGANDNNATFREYKDFRNGFLLKSFSVAAEKPDEAKYLTLFGGSVGRDRRGLRLDFSGEGDHSGEFVGEARVLGTREAAECDQATVLARGRDPGPDPTSLSGQRHHEPQQHRARPEQHDSLPRVVPDRHRDPLTGAQELHCGTIGQGP